MSGIDALDAFRRERGLLAGDDLAAWLAQAGLGVEEWAGRVLAGDTADLPGALEPPSAARPLPELPVPVPQAPPHVWMDRPGGCGRAALRVVCDVLGVASPTVGEDASLAELVTAARELGLPASALKASRHRAGELPAPWIAHVDGDHWIVVHRVHAADVTVSDPARGAGRLNRRAFERRWSGWCAVFAPAPGSA